MKNISQRDIWLCYGIDESDTALIYETAIACGLPMPNHIIDSKGRLFQKNKTISESEESGTVTYFEVSVTALSDVEVVMEAIDVG